MTAESEKLGDESAYPDAAYPLLQYQRVGNVEVTDIVNRGLTKREVFAAMAMQGLCAGIDWSAGVMVSSKELTEDAISIADALLEGLAK